LSGILTGEGHWRSIDRCGLLQRVEQFPPLLQGFQMAENIELPEMKIFKPIEK
ncbi:hypothetical protein BSL78_09474, partial [Apostichopus japonicus]